MYGEDTPLIHGCSYYIAYKSSWSFKVYIKRLNTIESRRNEKNFFNNRHISARHP